MKCLMKYQWVKLPRNRLPEGKGVMGAWARLASRAAFRKGQALYCGHINAVSPGMWSGGIVGLKSILCLKSRQKALEVLQTLAGLGYVQYTLDSKTEKADISNYRLGSEMFRRGMYAGRCLCHRRLWFSMPSA